jgi:hypothetical protein
MFMDAVISRAGVSSVVALSPYPDRGKDGHLFTMIKYRESDYNGYGRINEPLSRTPATP